MLPHRLQGIGTEYTVAPNSTSGATKILPHWVHLKMFIPLYMIILYWC